MTALAWFAGIRAGQPDEPNGSNSMFRFHKPNAGGTMWPCIPFEDSMLPDELPVLVLNQTGLFLKKSKFHLTKEQFWDKMAQR